CTKLASIVAKKYALPLTVVSALTHHDRADSIGEDILGNQPSQLYTDDAASLIYNFRMKVMMEKADLVVALFGEDYKQRNTAMDASAAITLGKTTIIIRPEKFIHPLKELSNRANVTVETVEQALDVIKYIYE